LFFDFRRLTASGLIPFRNEKTTKDLLMNLLPAKSKVINNKKTSAFWFWLRFLLGLPRCHVAFLIAGAKIAGPLQNHQIFHQLFFN
jgi:hypothetical protein